VGGRKALDAAKAKFAAAEGDPVTFLNVHRAWLEHGRSHRW
jgi:ATP-dependent RNA helicase DDX35